MSRPEMNTLLVIWSTMYSGFGCQYTKFKSIFWIIVLIETETFYSIDHTHTLQNRQSVKSIAGTRDNNTES